MFAHFNPYLISCMNQHKCDAHSFTHPKYIIRRLVKWFDGDGGGGEDDGVDHSLQSNEKWKIMIFAFKSIQPFGIFEVLTFGRTITSFVTPLNQR